MEALILSSKPPPICQNDFYKMVLPVLFPLPRILQMAIFTPTSDLYPVRRGTGWESEEISAVQMRDEEVLKQDSEEGEVDVQDILEQSELTFCMANITTASPEYNGKENKSNS